MNYDNEMDKECIELCNALNYLEGIETYESCCGHGVNFYSIFFKADCKNNYSLSIIARAFNKRYSQTSIPFIIELETSEMNYPKYHYWIHSTQIYKDNEDMLKDVQQLVANIKYWSSEIFKEYFNKNK